MKANITSPRQASTGVQRTGGLLDASSGFTVSAVADAHWRLVLESMWRRKLDEAIALTKAFYEAMQEYGETPSEPALLSPRRLSSRIDRAYEELADIEDAIARVDNGRYGLCGGCNRPIADERLADEPQVRYCPACSLLLVSRQRS